MEAYTPQSVEEMLAALTVSQIAEDIDDRDSEPVIITKAVMYDLCHRLLRTELGLGILIDLLNAQQQQTQRRPWRKRTRHAAEQPAEQTDQTDVGRG